MINTISSERVHHPDTLLLARVRGALEWWADQPVVTPTSSITGGGAIAAIENAVSRLVDHRPTLALPSATYGLRTALLAVGVRPGDEVLVSALDWPAARAATASLGAHPVPVDVDPATLTINPDMVAHARSPRTRALLVTHLHGVCANVPAMRAALGNDLPIIEDAAQAFGATLDGRPAGALGDIAVLSFGPTKVIDVGELAVLIAHDDALFTEAIRRSQHPVRQRLHGITEPDLDSLTGRAAPLAALLAAHELHQWPRRAQELRQSDQRIHKLLESSPADAIRLAIAPRRTGVPGTTAILLPAGNPSLPSWAAASNITVSISGATPCAELSNEKSTYLASLIDRVRLLRFGF